MERRQFFKSLFVAGAGSVLLPGCGDLLQPKVTESLTEENFFGSEADFRSAVSALYSPFITNWGSNDPGVGSWYSALYNADPGSTYLMRSEITTDELYSPWPADFTDFTWGPATFQGDGMSTYAKIRFVARATDAIEKISNSDANVSDSVRQEYVAEAKCLRGWLLYVLLDFFGPVNARLTPETLNDTEIRPRPSMEEYVASIEQDLTEAIPNLPNKYHDDPNNWGRVTKGTARMVLLRLYMHRKNWSQAEQVARDLMGMNYQLMSNYEDVFNVERNDEIIHAVQAGESSPNYYLQQVFPSDFQKSGDIQRSPGWYGLWMHWDFYDKYESGDERLNTILDFYVNGSGTTVDRNSGMQGAIPVKFTSFEGGGPGHTMDQPVFRYAEVLLSLAEAINEQRGPSEAYQYVDQVRERADVDPWEGSGMSQSQFRDAILEERGRELYAEGVRRQDLIRHGKFIEYAQDRGTNAQEHHVRFPIPEPVMTEADGAIQQNPGY